MHAFLRESRVADEEGFQARQLSLQLLSEVAVHLGIIPGRAGNILLQSQEQSFRLVWCMGQSFRHGLDDLALSVQEEARDVAAQGAPSFGAPSSYCHRVQVPGEFSVELVELRGRHVPSTRGRHA